MMHGPYNITEDYRVAADSLCYHLQKKYISEKGNNKGEEYWVNAGYYGRIEHLVTALLNLELMEHLGDLKLAIERIDTVEKHLDVLVKIKCEREKTWS